MKYRFFTLKQAENALHLAEKTLLRELTRCSAQQGWSR